MPHPGKRCFCRDWSPAPWWNQSVNLWLSVSAHSFFTFSLSQPTFPEHRTSSHRVYLVTDKWEEGWGSAAQLKVRGNYWVMKQAPTIRLLHNKNYHAREKSGQKEAGYPWHISSPCTGHRNPASMDANSKPGLLAIWKTYESQCNSQTLHMH